eukprot:97980_1
MAICESWSWNFIEEWVTQIISSKCNLRHPFCPIKPLNSTQGRHTLLLGFASNDDKVSFVINTSTSSDECCNANDGRTQIIESEITHNEDIDRIFDIEIDQTLASALDLLPDFLSIPIGEDAANTENIDQCLELLKSIDPHSSLIKKDESGIIHKISEMKRLIERLQLAIGDDEGYISSQSDYEYSVESEHNYTLMGDVDHTTM